MELVIDLSSIPTNSPIAFGWWFFKTIGWLFPAFLFIYGLLLIWQSYIRTQYRKQRKYILLAIDVPKDNEQTPRAVINLFSHLAGAHQPLNFYHKWWFGEIPESFSFEIISVGGYIQFIVHLEASYRDLMEAMIYAQYPDAEITEVEDYTKRWNITIPNEKYDLMGMEIKLAKNEVYPVITFKEFEDTLIGELKDPMASILESLSRIGPGEEMWIQFVTTPADNDWGKKAQPVINKIIGAKTKSKKNIFDWIFDTLNAILTEVFRSGEAESAKSTKDEPPNQMLYLTPGEKDDVAAIEEKTGKLGFHTKIRYIYLAEKPVFDKSRGVKTVYGAFKQFNTLGLNSFKPDKRTYTGGIVWFKKRRLVWRKNKILRRYKNRCHFMNPGDYGAILNTEELASLWHFPMMTVKAPMVKKTTAKKAEPPMSLPTNIVKPIGGKAPASTIKTGPPPNLPVA